MDFEQPALVAPPSPTKSVNTSQLLGMITAQGIEVVAETADGAPAIAAMHKQKLGSLRLGVFKYMVFRGVARATP